MNKPSELFEGENSSLRKTFNEACKQDKEIEEINLGQYEPQYVDSNGLSIWDAREAQIKELAEKINQIIIVVNKLIK